MYVCSSIWTGVYLFIKQLNNVACCYVDAHAPRIETTPVAKECVSATAQHTPKQRGRRRPSFCCMFYWEMRLHAGMQRFANIRLNCGYNALCVQRGKCIVLWRGRGYTLWFVGTRYARSWVFLCTLRCVEPVRRGGLYLLFDDSNQLTHVRKMLAVVQKCTHTLT